MQIIDIEQLILWISDHRTIIMPALVAGAFIAVVYVVRQLMGEAVQDVLNILYGSEEGHRLVDKDGMS